MDRDSSPTDFVRKSFETVARDARFLTIRHDRLKEYAAKLPDRSPSNTFDTALHFVGDDEATASYVLALDSINFGSGYKEKMAGEGAEFEQGSLYYTLAFCLKQHFEMTGALSVADMAAMTAGDVAGILGLDPEKGRWTQDFVGACAGMLSETGQLVEEKYNGLFMNFVEAAGGSADRLVAQLLEIGHFRDEHRWNGEVIAFYKRAQIAAADLHLAFGHKGRALFSDIERLTMFADNAVPHVLRMDGILEYTDDLAVRIDRGGEIASGSEEEIEIRGCAGQAVELIAREKNMVAMTVDHILWHRSKERPGYKAKPTHRTLSVFY